MKSIIVYCMGKRLKQILNEYSLTAGKNWKAKLSVASGVGISTIVRAERGEHLKPVTVQQIALGAGLSQEDALALAHKCLKEAKKTA